MLRYSFSCIEPMVFPCIICRDHTHPFNELRYSPAPWVVITMSFDADGSGFSSMPQPRMQAWSVDGAGSVGPPYDCGGNDSWRRGTVDSLA